MRDDDILEEELRIAHEQMLEDQGVETALFRRQLPVFRAMKADSHWS